MDPAPPATVGPALPDADRLTFLFTDMEGSTALWEHHETLMHMVMARHDALLDGIIAAHGGQRVKERGEGDSVFAVFARPADALATALAMAQAVLAEPWPAETPIRVRMGLHSGSAQLRAGDYYGPEVNRCARIRSLGHGNQVLLSAATATLVRDLLPQGVSLRALGAHSLKGLSTPEEVFQLCHPSLPSDFPPLLSPQAPRHNLPQVPTALIGREAAQGEVLALLAQARLVTLVGSGGVGKTRLALAVAAELVDQSPDGVWLVELAALTAAALVPGAVAQALGLREEPDRPLVQTLIAYLRDRHLLLVLDNCEHLVAACAELSAAVLRACPHVRILATSREGLDVAGERRWRVPSLSAPAPAHQAPPELVGSYEAVRLFVARARERRADFLITAKNARAIAQICAHLDGIPLAIELAAARVPALGAEDIAARLDDRFRLLTGGARDVLPRQRTLRAALDWSYNLLTAREQSLLDRLSVFAGGCTLTAAEAVCADAGGEDGAIVDLLDRLVNKSLVQAEESVQGTVRYGLLETVRQYGQERLAAAGVVAGVRARHLGWCVALAEEAAPRLTGPEQRTWLDRLEAEHDNLRAALGWSLEGGAGALRLRLAAALWRFWYMRGYLSEGRRWLGAVLENKGAGSAALRATALSGAGALAFRQADHEQATALHEEALTLQRELGDRRGIAMALGNLGTIASEQGDYARATALLEEALALLRELGDRRGIAISLNNLGNVAFEQGDYAGAAALQEEALDLHRELGDREGMALALGNVGNVAFAQGDYARAAALQEEALTLHRELGETRGLALSLHNLGHAVFAQGDDTRAAALQEEALMLCHTIGDRWLGTFCLEAVASVASAQGQPARAARLFGAADAARRLINAPVPPHERTRYAHMVAAVRAQLDDETFAAAWALGQALPLEQAIAEALHEPDAHAEARRGSAATSSAAQA